ncbi:hypothetical protein BGZ82_005002 [Podila clonocystis]|nr:hypothetical protein BGZ82_005002 [Podila clonocystis]
MSATPTSPRLPIELIIQIAKQIDGPTVAVFLQVCRQWRDLFNHLRLRDISRSHWHHPKFPLRDTIQLRETKLAPVLRHFQSLEWFTNTALTAPPVCGGIEHTRRRQRQYPGERQFLPRRQVPVTEFVRLLGLMSTTLSSLTFGHREISRQIPFRRSVARGRRGRSRRDRPLAILPLPNATGNANTHPTINNITTNTTTTTLPRLNVWQPATSIILQTVLPCIVSLERLTCLRLDLRQSQVPAFVPPLDWLPLLSRLEELQLEGTAPLFTLPAREELVQSAPWRLRVLKIPMRDIVFVACSPRLRALQLHHVSYRDYDLPATITPSTTPLGLWCPDLEALTLTGFSSRSQALEQTAVISSLRKLKSLVYVVQTKEHLAFLTSHEEPGHNVKEMACPMLEHLEIPAGAQSLLCGPEIAATLSNMFRTRPKLKRLLVPLARCDPRELFALPPPPVQDFRSWEPACADELEELSIGLYPARVRSLFTVKEWPKDQRKMIWRLVFRCLSAFRNLKVLSIRSVDIDRQAAVEEIACAGGWMNMERLTMMDPRAAVWQDYELARWLELLLGLKYVYLIPLKPDNLAEIREWMVELGFCHVTLGWENWRTIKY